jgi:undecaprenyl-diphosphatase
MERAGDTALLQNIHRLDLLAFGWCHRRSAEAMIFVAARWISRSADGWLYLLLALLFLAARASDAMAFITLGCQAFALERTAYLLTKNTCRRRRPPDILPGFRSQVIAADRFSFPSGHTSAAFLFAGLCAQEFGFWAALLLYPWACCVAASRVFLGVHFPSDTAAGALLGSSLLLAAHALFAA